jgi:hypothetical protein
MNRAWRRKRQRELSRAVRAGKVSLEDAARIYRREVASLRAQS